MNDYAKVQKSGAWVTMSREPLRGLYEVKVYSAGGNLLDKVRCDDYHMALDYRRSFNKIAKAN